MTYTCYSFITTGIKYDALPKLSLQPDSSGLFSQIHGGDSHVPSLVPLDSTLFKSNQNQMNAGCVTKPTIKHVFLKALKHKVENVGVFIMENMYIRCFNKQIVKFSICGSFNCSAWAFSTDL